jgi:hypothetical protein
MSVRFRVESRGNEYTLSTEKKHLAVRQSLGIFQGSQVHSMPSQESQAVTTAPRYEFYQKGTERQSELLNQDFQPKPIGGKMQHPGKQSDG